MKAKVDYMGLLLGWSVVIIFFVIFTDVLTSSDWWFFAMVIVLFAQLAIAYAFNHRNTIKKGLNNGKTN